MHKNNMVSVEIVYGDGLIVSQGLEGLKGWRLLAVTPSKVRS